MVDVYINECHNHRNIIRFKKKKTKNKRQLNMIALHIKVAFILTILTRMCCPSIAIKFKFPTNSEKT